MNVFVVDPHAIYRRGLAASLADLPEVGWVAEAASVEDARRDRALAGADVLVLDRDAAGAEALVRDVSAARPRRVVLCSAHTPAGGALAKATLTPRSLAAAIGAGADRAPWPRMREAIRPVAPANGHAGVDALTTRERRVLSLIADGHQTRDVARALSYSERTVKNVLHEAAAKLHARSRTQAVACAVRSGLI